MRYLFFGTYDAALHPRVAVLMEGLRDAGHEVVEVNAPLGASTAEKVAALGSPVVAIRLLGRLLSRWASLWRQGRAAIRALRPDAVVVGYLGHFDVLLARVIAPRSLIALDHLIFAADTASDRGVRRGLRQRILGMLDRRAVRAADLVIVDTAEHAEMLRASDVWDRRVVVPVGASKRWFDAGDAASPDPGPDGLRVVFFGLYTPLQGALTIAQAIRAIPREAGISFTLVGDGQDAPVVRDLLDGDDRVDWRRWVEPDELPALVASHDVCLGIFGTTPKALRVVPNKIYQGLGAGRAVVTSDSAPQRRALTGGALFVEPGSPAALAAALISLAEDRGRLQAAMVAARSLRESFRPVEVVRPLDDAVVRLIEARAIRRRDR